MRSGTLSRLARRAAWATALFLAAVTVAGVARSARLSAEGPVAQGEAPSTDLLQMRRAPLAPTCHRLPTLIGTVSVPSVVARQGPSPTATPVATFDQTNPQGATQVFDLQRPVVGTDGQKWYRALLPMRPNGTTGYVPARVMRLSVTPYRIVVDARRLRLTLWKRCRKVGTYPIGLGKESTPTPVGHFYLISLLQPPTPNSVYGPYAYGLSAYSDVLWDWAGGGVVGLHGTNDPSSIGQRVSHGCIRMRNQDIERLVPILPLGAPVDIVG